MALSREDQALQAYIDATGTTHIVTATLGTYVSPSNPCSPHSPGSLHCAPGTGGPGRAIDLADATPSKSAAGLLAIFAAFGPVESHMAELIYAGAPYAIHGGQRVNGWSVFGTAVMNEHWTHVHAAVDLGMFLPHPQPPKVTPMYDPPIIMPNIVASLVAPNGGVWLLGVHGEIYAFGCKDYGAPNRHPEYWPANHAPAAQLNAWQGGYQVIATDGTHYEYPAV